MRAYGLVDVALLLPHGVASAVQEKGGATHLALHSAMHHLRLACHDEMLGGSSMPLLNGDTGLMLMLHDRRQGQA
eukprot:496796-Pelagomonas_calceolata.AAC.7